MYNRPLPKTDLPDSTPALHAEAEEHTGKPGGGVGDYEPPYMLRAKIVPQILDQINSDGIKGSLLMTVDGSLLGAAGEGMEGIHNKVVGAITSNMWSDFDKAGSSDDQLKLMIFDMEEGRLAVAKVTKDYLVCAYGDTSTQFGSLKNKIMSLCEYLEKELTQIE